MRLADAPGGSVRLDNQSLGGFCSCACRVFGGLLFALADLRYRRLRFGLSFGCDLCGLFKKTRRTVCGDAALSDTLRIQRDHLEQLAVASEILLILLASVDE